MSNKATWVYISFAAALVVGLWLILSLGTAYAHAPTDLAGRWATSPANGGASVNMTIEQSGRYFVVSVDQRPRMNLELVRDDGSHIELDGGDQTLTAQSAGGPDDFTFVMSGHPTISFTAHRVERTYGSSDHENH